MFNFSSSAIKALDSLLERLESETIEPIEKSIKDAKKNFKAGNYLAISSLLLLTGLAIVLSQIFTGQYFIQALIYFSKLEPKLVGQVLRKNFFMGMEMNSSGWNRDTIIRLFNRNDFCFSKLKVHEKVEVDSSAKVIDLRGYINHFAITKLSQTLDKANLYSELYASENKTVYPLIIILIKAQFAFFRTYFLQKGFLDGWRGFVLAFSNSVGVFYKYIKIYAKHKTKK